MPINIRALTATGVRHTNDILITDYFRYYSTAENLPRSLGHLIDRDGRPYVVLPPEYNSDADGDDGIEEEAEPLSDDEGDRGNRVDYSRIREVALDNAAPPQSPHYVWPRLRRCVTRLPAFSPMHGERYFLRLLLLNVPAYSFEQLRTYREEVYPNFSQAAIARGLVPHGDEARIAMVAVAAEIESEIATATPASLRTLFCIYCIHNRDAIQPEQAFDEFWRQMTLDFSRAGWRPGQGDSREGLTDNLLKALLVRELARWLTREGRSITEFLPSAADIEATLNPEERRLMQPESRLVNEHRNAQTRTQARAEYVAKRSTATAEQLAIMDYWIAEVTAGRSPQIFIDALAGRGKTYVMST